MPLLPDRMASDAVRARAVELLDKAAMTAAEGALLGLGSDVVTAGALDLATVDWGQVAGFAAGGAFLSVVLNIARGGFLGRRGKHE